VAAADIRAGAASGAELETRSGHRLIAGAGPSGCDPRAPPT
jgi:hypothetical protein